MSDLHTYAAMAHKGKNKGKTFAVQAASLYAAKIEAANVAGVKTSDVSVQLQIKADGTEVTGAIM